MLISLRVSCVFKYIISICLRYSYVFHLKCGFSLGFPRTVFTLRGSGGKVKISISVSTCVSPRSPVNFCAQAVEIVRVASLPCTRNGCWRHFRQRNTMVLAHFTSKPDFWLPVATQARRSLPGAFQMPPKTHCLGSRAGVILCFSPKMSILCLFS